MTAELLYRSKSLLSDDAIVEMVIWTVPFPVVGSSHRFKYSLFYGYQGHRVVCYDNERGKGDHKHVDGMEMPNVFSTVDQLVADFLDDVARRRNIR